MSSVDEARVLRGKDIVINDFITLHQPDSDEIIDFGEQHFYNVFYTLCSIPSDMKSTLWDLENRIDWNKISDWELFLNLCRNYTSEDTKLILGDSIDFSKSLPMNYKNGDVEEVALILGEVDENNIFHPDKDRIIRECDYNIFISYIRDMIGYTVKREKAANKVTKLALIDEDRRNKKKNANKEWKSNLVPIIVTLVNTEEFSYKYEEAFSVKIYQLMKSYYQIQNKKSAMALYQGSMSGFVDTSKIDKNAFQWIYTND